jgi:hypothetical protein
VAAKKPKAPAGRWFCSRCRAVLGDPRMAVPKPGPGTHCFACSELYVATPGEWTCEDCCAATGIRRRDLRTLHAPSLAGRAQGHSALGTGASHAAALGDLPCASRTGPI